MKHQNVMIAAAVAGLAAMSVAAFAGEEKEADAAPDPRIGEEVDSICFQRSINGWKPVKGEDDVVLLERGVNHWYRVELLGGCDERLFQFAQKIAIDSRPGGGCLSRFDTIIVEDTPGFLRRCSVTRIYEWNEDAADEPEDSEDSEETPEDDDS